MLESMYGEKLNNGFIYHPDDCEYPKYHISDYFGHDGDSVVVVTKENAPGTGLFTPVWTEWWFDLPDFNNKIQALRFIKKHCDDIY